MRAAFRLNFDDSIVEDCDILGSFSKLLFHILLLNNKMHLNQMVIDSARRYSRRRRETERAARL